jgi:hypothetical protein
MIAARNGWVVALDNLSSLTPWLSDGLCRLATGSGFATRELYSDDDETIFSATRPIIINGIGDVATRSDLIDRSLLLTLPAIPETRRRDEREMLRTFAAVRPRILGALLTAVSAALRNRLTIRLSHVPRLADFAHWVTAAETGLSWSAGTFMHAYDANRADAHELALEGSTIAPPLRAMVAETEAWEGTARELLDALTSRVGEPVRRGRDWPAGAPVLAKALRRIAPNLRAVGVIVDFDRDSSAARRRLIRIRQGPDSTVQIVPTVQSDADPDGSDGLDSNILPLRVDEEEL